mgnify:FL=1
MFPWADLVVALMGFVAIYYGWREVNLGSGWWVWYLILIIGIAATLVGSMVVIDWSLPMRTDIYQSAFTPPWPLTSAHPIVVGIVASLALLVGLGFALLAFGNGPAWFAVISFVTSIICAQFGTRSIIALVLK